ncbi:Protein of unknown function [Clostridium collagenovorans DSM 3089]|uniref:DUF1292 domain-containing protein n=1 Tax=Clostridium collagenovorans DSM 3089 TaxID=1121306 RepID=A0A1M5TJ72_9CLOT|nr:DUF1292 domain-containing protein [Clostridium collagenovorans]SHH50822.1 Protein of unknown function [Clostridium collagenovorans DSM 3089]
MSEAFMVVENGKGEQVELELVDRLNIDSKEYVILSQMNSDDAFAYRIDEKNGKRKYSSIGAGAEFKKVFDAYVQKHEND